jgi:peptide/nickel transport system permease protein
MPSSIPASAIEAPAAEAPRRGLALFVRRNPTIVIGGAVMLALAAIAILAPWIAGDPLKLAPINRLRPPSERFWFGTDQFGRDVFARTIHGTRISLIVGLSVAVAASALGLLIGLVCGFNRTFDAIVMRIMDGIMAIPSC